MILFGTWEEVLDQLLSVCCMHNFVKNLIFREEICMRKYRQKISTMKSVSRMFGHKWFWMYCASMRFIPRGGVAWGKLIRKAFDSHPFWGKVGWKDLLSDNERRPVRSPIGHLVYWAEALLRLNWWQIANISDLLPFLICCQIAALTYCECKLEYKDNWYR